MLGAAFCAEMQDSVPRMIDGREPRLGLGDGYSFPDPYRNQRDFSMLRDRVVEYNLAVIDQWLVRGVDVQGTLTRGSTKDDVREVRQWADSFGRFTGGCFGGTSHSVMPETPLDNVLAMYEAFLEHQKAARPNLTGST